MLHKDTPWEWSEECEAAFIEAKCVLSSTDFLLHYDPSLPVVVECDASLFGVGACLLQNDRSGSLRPVAFVSRSLVAPEKNYSQIEREALAILFAVKRLHQYLYGRHFVLRTDHKPLLKIFGEKSSLPSVTAARLERWAVTLSSYQYSIQYIKGSDNVIADCLSRLPIQLSVKQEAQIVPFLDDVSCDPCQDLPISATDVAEASRQDPTMCKVMYFTTHGWSTSAGAVFPSFYRIREELSVESGCLMWANRVVVPVSLRSSLLEELHQDHLGVSKMKAIARSFFWWPKLDGDIASIASHCHTCNQFSRLPRKEEIHHWVYPSRAFERVHIDFAEYRGHHFFLISDAFSKWSDIYSIGKSTTTSRTIQCLQSFISVFGIPSIIVSDNGPQFTSKEFVSFCEQNGIRHKRSPPYHPATNGQVERLVQELKKFLTKLPQCDPVTAVSKFLFMYRNTPHAATQVTPASLIFKITPTTRFSFLQPQFGDLMQEKSDVPVSSSRSFQPGDSVWIIDHRSSQHKWIPAFVLSRIGPLTYSTQVSNSVRHVHVEHMRAREVLPPVQVPTQEAILPPSLPSSQCSIPVSGTTVSQDLQLPDEVPSPPTTPQVQIPELRQSGRTIKAPNRLDL